MQTKEKAWENKEIIPTIKNGGIVVMPTDTIYGIVGKALDVDVVENIYTIRKRNPEKPCIILIGDIGELDKFSIILNEQQKNIIENFSTPTSFVLDCPLEKLKYLHRGTNTLAFRIPQVKELRDLIKNTGPSIAPSANLEEFPESENIEDAKKYFGDSVDLYVDGGTITSKASRVIKFNKDNSINTLRE